jgi:hypothetical protein
MEEGVIFIKILSGIRLDRSNKTTKAVRQNSPKPARDSNLVPSRYNPGVLPLNQTALIYRDAAQV